MAATDSTTATKTAKAKAARKATGPVERRMLELRDAAATDPAGAQEQTWEWIQQLGRNGEEEQLAELFGLGDIPENLDGQTEGILVRFVAPPVLGPALNQITQIWMPWLGKRFDAASSKGENLLATSAHWPSKLLWPTYAMREAEDGRFAFDFNTAVEAGRIEPSPQVLVIDYAPIEDNPNLIIRQIRDELVQLVPGAHLGRMLFKLPGNRGYANLAYFALRQPNLA